MLIQSAFSAMSIFSRFRHPSHPDIVFVGDSITKQGGDSGGYVDLIKQAHPDDLRSVGDHRTIAYYGLSGGRAADLWAGKCDWSRTIPYADILKTAPKMLVLYIGVNDIWHEPPTSPEVFRSTLSELVSQAKSTGAIVILATPTVIGENITDNPQNAMLDEFSQIAQAVAVAQQVIFCNLRQAFVDYLKIHNCTAADQGILTRDRVHMNAAGNQLIADCFNRSIAQANLSDTNSKATNPSKPIVPPQ
jgi:lysophospholipase L1-like esterase